MIPLCYFHGGCVKTSGTTTHLVAGLHHPATMYIQLKQKLNMYMDFEWTKKPEPVKDFSFFVTTMTHTFCLKRVSKINSIL